MSYPGRTMESNQTAYERIEENLNMTNTLRRDFRQHRSHFSSQYQVSRTGRKQGGAFTQPLINHVVFVLDGSSSMDSHTQNVVKVVNEQVRYLARRSTELGQETRVSIYVFADGIECLVFDLDVLHLPEIDNLYEPYGNTALVGATMKALKDLGETAQTYGNHSFLIFTLSDGLDNASFDENGYRYDTKDVAAKLSGLPENWTLVGLVPDAMAKMRSQDIGFPTQNLSIWDATSANGMNEVGEVVMAGTEQYLTQRSAGVTGTRSFFSTGADAVNKATVTKALQPLPMDKYALIPVEPDGAQKGDKVRVDTFIKNDCGMQFRLGSVYYQWSKKETVQPQKKLAVVQKSTGKVFMGSGDEVRSLIGLPNLSTRTAPQANPDYEVFVQSTAPNRNLLVHTKVLVML